MVTSRSSSVNVVTRLHTGRLGFDSRQKKEFVFFLFLATASRPVLGHIQPPIQQVPGLKQPRREADHSLPSSTEVKNTWSYTSTFPNVLADFNYRDNIASFMTKRTFYTNWHNLKRERERDVKVKTRTEIEAEHG